jgi:hypothetical protein
MKFIGKALVSCGAFPLANGDALKAPSNCRNILVDRNRCMHQDRAALELKRLEPN